MVDIPCELRLTWTILHLSVASRRTLRLHCRGKEFERTPEQFARRVDDEHVINPVESRR